MLLYDGVVRKKKKMAVIGLGYVGRPLVVAFGKHADAIEFDISADKIDLTRIFLDVKRVGSSLRDKGVCKHWSL